MMWTLWKQLEAVNLLIFFKNASLIFSLSSICPQLMAQVFLPLNLRWDLSEHEQRSASFGCMQGKTTEM